MYNTKIEWCDSTWNPVTGCYNECPYCYARNMAHRFSGGGENWPHDRVVVLNEKMYGEEEEKAIPYPYGFVPTLHRYRLDEYREKKGRSIFVCSMADLFGSWIPDDWIMEVFTACENAPQHNYLFLTKNPERYLELDKREKLPHRGNMWYGASVTNTEQLRKTADVFKELEGDIKKFFSVEPMLEDFTYSLVWTECCISHLTDWVIIGAETGQRKNKVIPKKEWLMNVNFECSFYDDDKIPVFMKNSLADIWGESLVQEFPEELKIQKS